MKKTLIAFFIASLISTSAQAAIVDSGDYFIDENTGYTWMDLTNFDLLTYNEVESQIQETDFQIATLSLLEELWSSTIEHTFDYLYSVIGGTPNKELIAGLFNNEIGDNTAGLAWTWNYLDWTLESEINPYNSEEYNIFKDINYEEFGYWVVNTSLIGAEPNVNTVPEPNTLVLFGVGLIGLVAFRRTRQS